MNTAEIPYSNKTDATYENFIADCPSCGVTNTFNRASDLQTFEPIDFRTVTCQSQTCQRPFNINNDTINAAHEMLIFGCYAFIEGKEYMQCVLSTCQAYEVFFNHFMYVRLIYRPYAHEGNRDLPRLNRLIQQLYCRVQQLTFEPMRRIVLRHIVDAVAPASLAAAEDAIVALPKRPRDVRSVPEQDIENMPDGPLRALLLRLLKTDIDDLRNQVVHKDAYRPTRERAMRAHDEAREILFGLTAHLRLGHHASWYISEAGR